MFLVNVNERSKKKKKKRKEEKRNREKKKEEPICCLSRAFCGSFILYDTLCNVIIDTGIFLPSFFLLHLSNGLIIAELISELQRGKVIILSRWGFLFQRVPFLNVVTGSRMVSVWWKFEGERRLKTSIEGWDGLMRNDNKGEVVLNDGFVSFETYQIVVYLWRLFGLIEARTR